MEDEIDNRWLSTSVAFPLWEGGLLITIYYLYQNKMKPRTLRHTHGKALQLFKPELAFVARYWMCMYINVQMTEAKGNRRRQIHKSMEENITGYKESKSWGVFLQVSHLVLFSCVMGRRLRVKEFQSRGWLGMDSSRVLCGYCLQEQQTSTLFHFWHWGQMGILVTQDCTSLCRFLPSATADRLTQLAVPGLLSMRCWRRQWPWTWLTVFAPNLLVSIGRFQGQMHYGELINQLYLWCMCLSVNYEDCIKSTEIMAFMYFSHTHFALTHFQNCTSHFNLFLRNFNFFLSNLQYPLRDHSQ